MLNINSDTYSGKDSGNEGGGAGNVTKTPKS